MATCNLDSLSDIMLFKKQMTEYYIEYGTTFYTTQTQTELSRVVSGHIHAVTKLRKWEGPMINTKFKIIKKKNL